MLISEIIIIVLKYKKKEIIFITIKKNEELWVS